MSERFTRLFTLPKNLYTEGSPVVVAAGALLKDNSTGRVLVQLKIRNINSKPIKAVMVKITPYDISGDPIGTPIEHQYLDFTIMRDGEYGQKIPVMMPDNTTRSFGVAVTKVIFSGMDYWTGPETEWTSLPYIQKLNISDNEMLKQYRIEYGQNCQFETQQVGGDLWYCTCGALNRQSESYCHTCGKYYKMMSSVDMDVLAKKRDERLEKEKQAREEAARLAAEKEAEQKAKAAERKKKIIKTLKITIPIAAACIALVILFFTVILPLIQYNSAVNMYDAENYKDALPIFEKLGDYKDSVNKAKECSTILSIEYKVLDDDTIEITAFKGNVDLVNIPEKIDGHTVTVIGASAFSNRVSLVSVTIPDTVTELRMSAFFECTNLSSVTLSESLKSIGVSAFSACESLRSIEIPESVTQIDRRAFANCSAMTSATIPESVTKIDKSAFTGCKDITIYGTKGSEAEKFAKSKNIPFREG